MNLINVSTNVGHGFLRKLSVRRLNGNAHLKTSVAGNGGDADVAPNVLDDAIDNIEAKAGALADALGGEKWIEDTRHCVRWNAGAIVGNFHEDEIVFAGGADGELAAALHGIGGVVDEIGPDLIQFAAARHHFGEIGSILADDGDAAFELVIHDGESSFEAALDINFLHGTLGHVGIFLDGFDEIGDAGGT